MARKDRKVFRGQLVIQVPRALKAFRVHKVRRARKDRKVFRAL